MSQAKVDRDLILAGASEWPDLCSPVEGHPSGSRLKKKHLDKYIPPDMSMNIEFNAYPA